MHSRHPHEEGEADRRRGEFFIASLAGAAGPARLPCTLRSIDPFPCGVTNAREAKL